MPYLTLQLVLMLAMMLVLVLVALIASIYRAPRCTTACVLFALRFQSEKNSSTMKREEASIYSCNAPSAV
jgi:hypothetical protein